MAGIKGSQASSLAGVIPGADEAKAAEPKPASIPMPQVPQEAAPEAPPEQPAPEASATPAQRPSLEDIFAKHAGKPSLEAIFAKHAAGPSDEAVLKEANSAPEIDPNSSNQAQAYAAYKQANPGFGKPSFLGTKVQASFASKPEEKQALLEQNFGEKNVKRIKGEYYVKEDGKWNKFDREDVASLVASFAGPAVSQGATEILAAPGEAAAAVAAPETLGSSVLAVPAIRAAAGVGGEYLKQGAARLLNVPQRTAALERASQASENGLINAAFGGLGKVIEARLATKFGSSEASGALMEQYNALGEKKKLIDATMAAGADEKTKGLVSDLVKQGVLKPDPAAGYAVLLPNEAQPEIAAYRDAAKRAAQFPEFQKAEEARGKMWSESFETATQRLGNTKAAETTGTEALKVAGAMDDLYGGQIGALRKTAIERAGNGTVPTPRTGVLLDQMKSDIGYVTGQGAVPGKTMAATISENTGMEEANAAKLLGHMQRFDQILANGRTSPQVIDREYTVLRNLIDSQETGPAGQRFFKDPKYAQALIKAKDALRDDFTEGMKGIFQGQPDADALMKKYNIAMPRYGEALKAQQLLRNGLSKNTVGNEAFSKYVFSGALGGPDKVAAMKTLVEYENPELWHDVKGTYLRGLFEKHFDPSPSAKGYGGIDWSGMQKGLTQTSDATLKAAFGDSPELQAFKDLVQVGAQAQQKHVAFTGPLNADGLFKRSFSAIVKLARFHPEEAGDLLFNMGRNKAAEFNTPEGRAALLKQVSDVNRPFAEKLYEGLQARWQKLSESSQRKLQALPKPGLPAAANQAIQQNQTSQAPTPPQQ